MGAGAPGAGADGIGAKPPCGKGAGATPGTCGRPGGNGMVGAAAGACGIGMAPAGGVMLAPAGSGDCPKPAALTSGPKEISGP